MRRALAFLLLASCYEPNYPEGLLCSTANTCPPGQFCNIAVGRCFLSPGQGGEIDSGISDEVDARFFDAGGGGSPDADLPPLPTAEHLGDSCTRPPVAGDPTECDAFGLVCRFFVPDGATQPKGFCTFQCPVPGETTACANGYDEQHGAPVCVGGPDENICVILCGEEPGLPLECPMGLVCRDANDNSQTDTCLPGAP